MEEEWSEHYMGCPYCGYVDEETTGYPWGDLSRGTADVQCSDCGKCFQVECEYTVSFRSFKAEEV